jgi:CheY-like chemotaxis protein
MPLTFILAISHEPELLESRSSILRSAGYAVAQVLSVNQAIELLESSHFDLVLLGHSVPAQDRDYLTRLIRASGLLTPVVTVAPLGDGHFPDAFTDATVNSAPEKLLSGIREVLLKAGKNVSGSKTTTPFQTTAD